MTDGGPQPITRPEAIGMAGVLMLALVLRIIHLNADLWYDEILTLLNYVRLPWGELVQTYGSLNNHVLYSWMAKISVGIFGESAWAMRLPAVLFGLGSIVAVWLFMRRVTSLPVAMLTALVLAISYHHVWFSQNARGYTGLLFFISLSSLFILRAQRGEKPWQSWMLWAACVVGAMAIHLTAAFFFAAQAAVLLIDGARKAFIEREQTVWQWLRMPLAASLVVIVALLLFYSPIMADIASTMGEMSAPSDADAAGSEAMKEWENPLRTAIELMASFGALGAVLPIALGFAAIGGWQMTRRAPVAAGAYPAAIVVTLVILVALGFRVWPRYFFIEIGFLVAAALAGAFQVADWVERWRVAGWRLPAPLSKTLGTLVILSACVLMLRPNYNDPKMEISDAIAAAALAEGQGRPVVTVGLAKVPFTDYRKPDWPFIEDAAGMRALLRDEPEACVVSAFPTHFRGTYPDIHAILVARDGKPQRLGGTLPGAEIELWGCEPS
ncbi:glycosyltransferase family 39 protein [Parvularcula lutaonensis]|uniref:Glycosyltransferase family 39 protein n=1 Tax=Parvularcula lutaonensis TaxID=491923 RepID=A0ABV7M9G5_9PROT|nr:glycosyltransferase family 39 protein [Parvularcula lutaonensis]GGY44425.1 hypothetical protein GCM10007148_11660 [Parvularcula lutaonensis]